MPEMNQYPNGTFCWPELSTTDSDAAKSFYTAIFGWELRDDPVGPDAVYTMASINGRNVGAMYQQNAEQKNQGVPPHWLSYVSVDDVDASVEKAKSLGGSAILDPMDVMDVGRMAVLSDPTGAAFAMWQPLQHAGAQVLDEPGTLCWNELMTTDEKEANRFYTGLFDWTTETDNLNGDVEYTSFANGDRPAGGMIKIDPNWGDIPSNWVVYFAVADCDVTLAAIESSGGSTLMPARDIEEIGRFAMCQDPQGATFAIIALDQQT
jgi:predicted enzyme related to lactoylglutathione lyase